MQPCKACFPPQPYRTETCRISLFPEYWRVELMTNDTNENTTVRYNTMWKAGLGAAYMIPLCRDTTKREIVLMYWKLP